MNYGVSYRSSPRHRMRLSRAVWRVWHEWALIGFMTLIVYAAGMLSGLVLAYFLQ
jgi:hypothetical protein